MEIIKWGILLILVLPVPFILGMIPVSYMESSYRTPAMTYVCGWFVSFFVFELIAIPLILLERSFTMLSIIYSILITVVMVVSLLAGRGLLKDYSRNIKRALKMPLNVKIGWVVVFIIIALQMLYAIMYEYYDGDDAYYIATAVATRTFDSMYLHDAYTGALYALDVRHAFSPTPIYQAWLSSLSHIAPAIVTHSVLGPVWLMFMYCIYGQIGNCLLSGKNKNYRPVFMIFVTVWFAFGNVSLYTAETFAMTRTWQGKGLMAGMVLPAIVLCLLYFSKEHIDKGIWMLFVCVCISAVFATSVSFMIIPTVVGIAAIALGVKKKSAGVILKVFACCVPCMIIAVLYVMMR